MKRKLIIGISLILFAIYTICGIDNVDSAKPVKLRISSKSNMKEALESIHGQLKLKRPFTFTILLRLMQVKKIKPGLYEISPSENNWRIVRKLMSGNQTPVNFVINNIVLKEDLAGKIAANLEIDSATVMDKLNDANFCRDLGYTTENILCLFLPNTYQMYWNINWDQFIQRMEKENRIFWTDERLEKAKALKLSKEEIYTLASLVQKEYYKKSERKTIAGVIYNRLNKGMALQIDATCIYATRDFTARRVNETHLHFASPYNTYMKTGLPPGPICIPEIGTIDDALNLESHPFLFYCAKPDLSGYHEFSTNFTAHIHTARQYQKTLNKKGIH
ncbi:MAG: endolytic transglycosylase MltG [Bacteroidetes bacterium]|nr:endolytic transglycosylase MltG [Bacteroidota bacterium]